MPGRQFCLLALTLVSSLVVACHSSGQQIVVDDPPAEENAAAAAPVEENPVEETPAEEASVELSSGRYWVRRSTRFMTSRGSQSPGEPAVTEKEGRTECRRMDVDIDNATPALRVYPDRRARQARVSLTDDGGDWRLERIELKWGYVELTRMCSEKLTIEPASGDEAYFESNMGPIFTDREACQAQPSTYLHRCVDGDCSYEEPLARPFEMASCQGGLSTMLDVANDIVVTSHDEAMQTWQTFEERVEAGTELWQRADDGQGCSSVDASISEEDRVHLALRIPSDDGGFDEHETVYSLEPLYHSAQRHHSSTTNYNSEGEVVGMGAAGGSSFSSHPLYLTRDAIMIEDRFLYLDRADCEPAD